MYNAIMYLKPGRKMTVNQVTTNQKLFASDFAEVRFATPRHPTTRPAFRGLRHILAVEEIPIQNSQVLPQFVLNEFYYK